MPSTKVVALCGSSETLTAAVRQHPTKDIGQLARKLYVKTGTLKTLANSVSSRPIEKDPAPTPQDLDAAEQCGQFPYRPSDLFLKIYHDCLKCLERNPFVGCCSPPLLGSSGVIPISIISIIPDIMRHYATVIRSAEHEVFIATNFLQKSRSLTIVSDALRELSKKVMQRKGKKIVIKFMYDRGTAEQLVRNHVAVRPEDWSKVGLPAPNEIPNIDMEVINYHRPLLGTFHCKFAVVDRRAAIISSNNIQDRANLEMMMHFEGPIVDSFYDMALWCWSNAMTPALPLIKEHPASYSEGFKFGPDSPYLKDLDLEEVAITSRNDLKRQHTEIIPLLEAADAQRTMRRTTSGSNSVENFNIQQSDTSTQVLNRVRTQGDRALRAGATMDVVNAATLVSAKNVHSVGVVSQSEVQRLTSEAAQIGQREAEELRYDGDKLNPRKKVEDTAGETEKPTEGEPGPISLQVVDETPDGLHDAEESRDESVTSEGRHSTDVTHGRSTTSSTDGTSEQDHAKDSQTTESADLLTIPADEGTAVSTARSSDHAQRDVVEPAEHIGFDGRPSRDKTARTSDVSRGHARASSVARSTGGRSFVSRHSRHESVAALTDHLNLGGGFKADSGVDRNYNIQDFSPYVVHSEHEPFPIALVNRPAHGMPGHEDILTPQNVAWLAGFKYAQRKVFIQSPTLNASPIKEAIIEACKRGVEVILWLNLGFNDQGEMIPFQGGTNEEVVTKLYQKLNPLKKGQHLKVFWYVGKDQAVPLNAAVKKRNCHIKFMTIDDEVGIAGNGNQDTQSWFHSQEANVMVDSPQVVREWMDALKANQNTGLYGRVDSDGTWRYEDGRPLENLNMFKGTGPVGRLMGFVGAFNRATSKKP